MELELELELELEYRLNSGGSAGRGEGGIEPYCFPFYFNWIKVRLQTQNKLCTLPGTALKKPVGGLQRLWVELQWLWGVSCSGYGV